MTYKKECFKIRISVTDNPDVFESNDWRTVKEILCGEKELEINPTMIVADPFLFVYNDRLFLFYEYKKLETPGVIKMTSTSDLQNWTEPIVVLKEDYHLSYPWVFEHEGRVYMVPETGAAHSIRLYEANTYLTQFIYKKTLLSRKELREDGITTDFSDSSLIKRDSLYFLMTTVKRDRVNELQLYISDKFLGPYRRHPQSPLYKGNKYGRNAGCLLNIKGTIFRVAQDCIKKYGDQVHLRKIDEMTENTYKESFFKDNILPQHDSFYKKGGHQFNYVTFKGKYIIATDAKEYHLYLLARISKFIKTIF